MLIPICFCCSETYVPYLYVAIQSLIEHASYEHIYEIHILETTISQASKRQLLTLEKDPLKHIKINFINVSKLFAENEEAFRDFKKNHGINSLIGIATIFIPEVFKNYEKILCLDADLVILSDVADLFKIDTGESVLAAVLDFQIIVAAKTGTLVKDMKLETYLTDVLGIEDYGKYVNAGILLVNTQKINEIDFLNNALNLVSKIPLLYPDQDIYNKICAGKIKFLDAGWNYQDIFENKHFLKVAGDNVIEDFFNFETPRILHFASKRKPRDLRVFSEVTFWKYARNTPYYECLLNMRIMEVQYERKKS